MDGDGSNLAVGMANSPMDVAKRIVRQRMAAVGRLLGATGVSPNTLTLFGLALNCVAATIVATESLLFGGIAFLIASAFDMLDGAVARATGKTTLFGAFLDSVMDRYSESVMFIALLIVAARHTDPVLEAVTGLALVGSLLVSYTRARAEGLGLDCEVGWLQRPERVILLSIGLIFSQFLLVPIIWFLAAVTNVTAIQRVMHVQRLLRERPESGDTAGRV